MKPNLYDLRQMRCPMALLWVKRHMHTLPQGNQALFILTDPHALADITRFLQTQAYGFDCQKQGKEYQLTVTQP